MKVCVDGESHYYAVRCPEHPSAWRNGYIYEHRVVLECKLQRVLGADEVAHHRNEDKTDNAPENLEVKDSTIHNSEHHATGITMVELNCEECGEDFERELRNVTSHPARFCSRSCNGRFQRRLQCADSSVG